MKKLVALFAIFSLVLFAACEKYSDSPTPTTQVVSPKSVAPVITYTLHLKVDNQTAEPCKMYVCYGYDYIKTQSPYISLTQTEFPVGYSTQTFTLNRSSVVYFLFTLKNSNQIITLSDGTTWGNSFNQTMTASTMEAGFIVTPLTN